MSAKGPYRFRLLHVIDVLAAICIAAIFVGVAVLVGDQTGPRDIPWPLLVGFGLFVGYMSLRKSVLTKL